MFSKIKNLISIITSAQYLVTFSVMIISLSALFVSIKQTRIMNEQRQLMHEQAKASVWPNLSITRFKAYSKNNRKLEQFSLNISNDGVGPAIVEGVRVCYNKKVSKNWWELFDIMGLPDSIAGYINNRGINQKVIKAGEAFPCIDFSGNLELGAFFHKHQDSLTIEVLYKSIYGDKWIAKMDRSGTTIEETDKKTAFKEEEMFAN